MTYAELMFYGWWTTAGGAWVAVIGGAIGWCLNGEGRAMAWTIAAAGAMFFVAGLLVLQT